MKRLRRVWQPGVAVWTVVGPGGTAVRSVTREAGQIIMLNEGETLRYDFDNSEVGRRRWSWS